MKRNNLNKERQKQRQKESQEERKIARNKQTEDDDNY